MPKTAVINRRRKRRSSRRRRNYSRKAYGAAARTENARRKRRRRRRRNPTGPVSVREGYSSGGYRRRPNPEGSLFDFNVLTQVTPAATAGVMLARWATHLAGEFEDDEPDIKHAIAIWIAAGLGGQIVGNVLNDKYKGLYAHIAALGFGGDLFLRKVFFKDADWLRENFYLGEDNEDYDEETDYEELDGFQDQSVLGQTYYDAAGNPWTLTAQGYQPANGQQMGQAPMLPEDPSVGYGSQLAGFQDQSVLGRRTRAYSGNSFGYTE
jgi:hypothetical protein